MSRSDDISHGFPGTCLPSIPAIRRLSTGFLALALVAPGPVFAECQTLEGRVRDGERWESRFGEDLVFILDAAGNMSPSPSGWDIEVRKNSGGEHDFVWVATPPYRFWNPRYIGTSYGISAAQAVARNVRRFGLVTSESSYDELAETVNFLLWKPQDIDEKEYLRRYPGEKKRLAAMLDGVGQGEFRILDYERSDPADDPPRGRIKSMRFSVELCRDGDNRVDEDGRKPPW